MIKRWLRSFISWFRRPAPRQVASLEIRILEEPKIADGRDLLVVDIEAFDGKRRPAEDASISVGLVLGLDELENVDAEALGRGRFRAQFTSVIAGNAVVHAWDRVARVAAKKMGGFIAGDPVAVVLSVGPPAAVEGALEYEVIATVEDAHGNPATPPRAGIVFGTTFGELSPVRFDPNGTFVSRIRVVRPGTATIAARDSLSGLESSFDLVVPAIALECPPAVHFTDDPEQRRFSVKVRVFTGPELLGSYNIALELNDLTAFVGAGASAGQPELPAPQIQQEAPNLVRISQSFPPTSATSGYFEIATLECECLGLGDSQVSVADAELTRSVYPAETLDRGEILFRLPDEPRLPAICPNKRVKRVCIRPIIIKGVAEPAVVKQKLDAHLKQIQSNFDAGCCTIDLRADDPEELDPPEVYKNEVAHNKNSDLKDDIPQVEWDARSERIDMPGEIKLGEINLSPGMAAMLCDRSKRDDTCINVYIVADDGMVGKYPAIPRSQEQDREAVGKVPPEVQPFGGADIKRQRLKPDGSGCEDVKIYKKDGNNRTEIEASDCPINAVVISMKNLETFETLKHEIGHMLGLRHPWEYDPATLERIKKGETEERRSVMWYGLNRHDYTIEECKMVTEFNCNGYQRS
jgi:Metallo-peptidase family M12B Reprolysin-like